jgi:hypothetical protein
MILLHDHRWRKQHNNEYCVEFYDLYRLHNISEITNSMTHSSDGGDSELYGQSYESFNLEYHKEMCCEAMKQCSIHDEINTQTV